MRRIEAAAGAAGVVAGYQRQKTERLNAMLKIDAARLIAAVVQSGMGEVELCVKAGVGHQTFAKMARGEMVRYPSIGKICAVLDLKPVEIIREVDEAIQTQGQSVLVSEAGRNAHQSPDYPQGLRLAAAGRIPG